MACENPCGNNGTINNCAPTNNCGYIIIIVLYILLAIILGSCFF